MPEQKKCQRPPLEGDHPLATWTISVECLQGAGRRRNARRARLANCTNSRTGWTIVHEAVERGHSGAMLTMAVQILWGPDSVNKKTRTGLTPAHVAASKRDTLALMALANLGADLSVLSADRVQLRELQKQASEAPETPEPLEQARLMLATLDPSALAQPKLETMQIDLATTKTTLETASERTGAARGDAPRATVPVQKSRRARYASIVLRT